MQPIGNQYAESECGDAVAGKSPVGSISTNGAAVVCPTNADQCGNEGSGVEPKSLAAKAHRA